MKIFFNKFLQMKETGQVNLATAQVKVLLWAGATPPDEDADSLSELTLASNELSAQGYSRKTLTNQSVQRDDTDDEINFFADNISWPDLHGNFTGHLYFIQLTDDSDSYPVLFSNDGGYPYEMNGGTYTIPVVEPIYTLKQSKEPETIAILQAATTDAEKITGFNNLKTLYGV